MGVVCDVLTDILRKMTQDTNRLCARLFWFCGGVVALVVVVVVVVMVVVVLLVVVVVDVVGYRCKMSGCSHPIE